MPETATWAYILRARGAGDRVANSEDGCHAKMEANAPPQPLWAAMTEPEDGAGLPSLLASLNVCGLPASVLAVVEREAGWLVNSDYPTLR